MVVEVGVGLPDNRKTDMLLGKSGKVSQLTKFRPKSLNPTSSGSSSA